MANPIDTSDTIHLCEPLGTIQSGELLWVWVAAVTVFLFPASSPMALDSHCWRIVTALRWSDYPAPFCLPVGDGCPNINYSI